MPYKRFEAFRDYVTITILAMGLVFIVSVFVIDITSPPVSQKRFEVVDKYESCDVVRYTTPSNEWVYFLDCSLPSQAAPKALE